MLSAPKIGVGKISWGLTFPVFHFPNHFLSIKLCFLDWTADYLGSLKKLV